MHTTKCGSIETASHPTMPHQNTQPFAQMPHPQSQNMLLSRIDNAVDSNSTSPLPISTSSKPARDKHKTPKQQHGRHK
jgi:hypothetical protein